jgi:hypothetical protein
LVQCPTDKRNWNLSQEILLRLRQSLAKEQEDFRDPELKALFLFIEVMSWKVPAWHHRGDPQFSWLSNPYLFEAFRRAIAHLMSAMRPSGEIVAPPPEPERNHRDDLFGDSSAPFKYPDSVDEYARRLARRVIERANEAAYVRHERGPVRLSVGGQEVEISPDEEDDAIMGLDHSLDTAAKMLLRGGKK